MKKVILLSISFQFFGIRLYAGICDPVPSEIDPYFKILSNKTLTSELIDIDGDGKAEAVEFILDSGCQMNGSRPDPGGETIAGEFRFLVKKDNRILSSQRLGEVIGKPENGEERAFRDTGFNLVFKDYNGDKQPDFSIGIRATFGANYFALLSIESSGKLKPLSFKNGKGDGTRLWAFINGSSFSASNISIEDGMIRFSNWYSGSGSYEYWRWNEAKQFFEHVKDVPIK